MRHLRREPSATVRPRRPLGSRGAAAILAAQTGTFAPLGDIAYPAGTAEEFADCCDPWFGDELDRTRPVPGNHEYNTPGAAGYFGYFGARAGDPTEGWYSYDLGAWHVLALNSECVEVGGCGVGSPMHQWLQADLTATGYSWQFLPAGGAGFTDQGSDSCAPVASPAQSLSSGHEFDDVPAWIDQAVRWAVAEGVVAGYGDGTCRPNRAITRAEVTRMLCGMSLS